MSKGDMRNSCDDENVLYLGQCQCPGCDIVLCIIRCYYWGKLDKGYKRSLHYLVQLHVKSIIVSKYKV